MPGTYLLVGIPGSGKTTLACTLEHPTLLIDVDCKAHRMANLMPLVKSGEVTIHQIREPLVSGKLSELALNPTKPHTKEPHGYVRVLNLLEQVFNNDSGFEGYKTVVLDSLSRLVEHLKRLLIYHASQGRFGKDKTPDMSWPAWGAYLNNLENLFTTLVQMDKNFICTAHEFQEVEQDPFTQATIMKGRWPLVEGQMRKKIAGYFDEVYWLERKVVTIDRVKKFTFSVRTIGRDIPARTSMNLGELENANLAELVKKGLPKT